MSRANVNRDLSARPVGAPLPKPHPIRKPLTKDAALEIARLALLHGGYDQAAKLPLGHFREEIETFHFFFEGNRFKQDSDYIVLVDKVTGVAKVLPPGG